MFKKNEKGFTLIELLVVIAILGVLAGVAVPRVLTSLATARQNADAANLALLQQAVERYVFDTGNWPITGTVLATAPVPTPAPELDWSKLVPNYVVKIPVASVTPADKFKLDAGGVVKILP